MKECMWREEGLSLIGPVIVGRSLIVAKVKGCFLKLQMMCPGEAV